MSFTLRAKLPGGHRIFQHSKGGFAIADKSGAIPETTEDGILWVNPTSEILIGITYASICVSKEREQGAPY